MTTHAKDIGEKILEEYPDVFTDIIDVLLFGGKQVIKPEDVEDAMPVYSYKTADGIHEEERDIAKYWRNGNAVISLIGLENQTAEDSDMVFRIIGYDGAAYRAQLLNGSARYPVVTLVLYYGSRHWSNSCDLKDHLIIPEQLKKYVSSYKINVFEISFLPEEIINRFQSDFRYVADYFVKIRTDPTYKGSDGELKHVDAVIKLLSALSGRPYDGPARVKVRKGEVKTMKNAISLIMDDAENKGRIEGINEGRIEGRYEGISLQKVLTASAMIHDGFTDDKIMRYTSLSKEEVEMQRKKLAAGK